MPDPAPPERPGLCASCVNAQQTGNRRGSEFILCTLSVTDPLYPRYPRLPVLSCDGHRPEAAASEASDD